MPPNPMPPDTAPEDVGLGDAAPAAAADQDLRAEAAADASREPPPPRSYIYCQRADRATRFRQFAERAKRESGWRHYEIDASHNPHITAPTR